MKKNPKCDRCDNRATMIAQNTVEIQQIDGYTRHEPAPEDMRFEYGCDDHPVESKVMATFDESYH